MTTASLHREMVEALRAAKRAIDDLAGQACCGPGCVDDEAMDAASECRAIARAALEGWEKREPLADDRFLDALIYDELTAEDGAALGVRIRRLLTNLDAALYGERG